MLGGGSTDDFMFVAALDKPLEQSGPGSDDKFFPSLLLLYLWEDSRVVSKIGMRRVSLALTADLQVQQILKGLVLGGFQLI